MLTGMNCQKTIHGVETEVNQTSCIVFFDSSMQVL